MKRLFILVPILLLGFGLGYGQRFAGQQASPGEGMRHGFGPICAGTLHEEAATLFGITTEELAELRREGLTLAEIADDHGVAVVDLTDTMLKARSAAIDRAVAEGDITEAQAELMHARSDEVIAAMIDREVEQWGGRLREGGRTFMRGRGSGQEQMRESFGPCLDHPQHLGRRWDR